MKTGAREVPKFVLPANALIIGETGSGKSCFMQKLLLHRKYLFSPSPPDKALLMCARYQPQYECWKEMFPGLEIVEGLQTHTAEEFALRNKHSCPNGMLLIVDDLMIEQVQSSWMANMFLSGRHFGFSSIISLWHTVFPRGKFARLLAVNSQIYVLMKSNRIRSQLGTLSQQLYGNSKFLPYSYDLATKGVAYGYLVVDTASTRSEPEAEHYSVRSQIFPSDSQTYAYLPTNE